MHRQRRASRLSSRRVADAAFSAGGQQAAAGAPEQHGALEFGDFLTYPRRNPGLRAAWFFVTLRNTLRFQFPDKIMIRCHLSTLMGRDKLRISDVAQRTGLNRSTITALYNETATRVELSTIEILCGVFRCQVGDLLEIVASTSEVNS